MAETIPPCTLGTRHKWVWQKNVTTYSGTFGTSGAQATLTRRGLYQCACGAVKHDTAKPEV